MMVAKRRNWGTRPEEKEEGGERQCGGPAAARMRRWSGGGERGEGEV